MQDGFGMSETMAYTICNSSGYSKVGSIGIPCPLVDVRIASLKDENIDAEIGEEGELCKEALPLRSVTEQPRGDC